MGIVPSMTKFGAKRVIFVRSRGGYIKTRAQKNDHGNVSWGSEAISYKTRILDTAYNTTNNELNRTKTLVKSTTMNVDSTPLCLWYLKKFDVEIKKKCLEESNNLCTDTKMSRHVKPKSAGAAKAQIQIKTK